MREKTGFYPIIYPVTGTVRWYSGSLLYNVLIIFEKRYVILLWRS